MVSKLADRPVRERLFLQIGDVVRAGPFKNLLGAINFVAIFRVHRNQNVALFDGPHNVWPHIPGCPFL